MGLTTHETTTFVHFRIQDLLRSQGDRLFRHHVVRVRLQKYIQPPQIDRMITLPSSCLATLPSSRILLSSAEDRLYLLR